MEHVDQWVEAWEVQQRVNLKLLKMVGEEGLKNSYAKRTREVSKVFSHIHNTRIMWLEALNMLPEGVRKIDKSADPKLDAIRDALQASSAGIVALIKKVMEKGKVAGFKRSPGAFVAYMIAHEAHHRGQVIVSMRISGHALVQEQIYSLWEWDKI